MRIVGAGLPILVLHHFACSAPKSAAVPFASLATRQTKIGCWWKEMKKIIGYNIPSYSNGPWKAITLESTLYFGSMPAMVVAGDTLID